MAGWWTPTLGRPCRIDFGGFAGLNVRAGTLENGQDVLWKDVGRSRRVARLHSKANPVVTPLAYAFAPGGGQPIAVSIRFKHGGREMAGLVALKIAGNHLRLRPLAR